MVILFSYQLESLRGGALTRIRCDRPLLCPSCGKHVLAYRDSVRRLCRREGGGETWYLIPRGFCVCCRKIHRMLPLFLCPFKHYLAAVIANVVNDNPAADPALMDYPCEITMDRWRDWAGDDFVNLAGDPLYACFSKNP